MLDEIYEKIVVLLNRGLVHGKRGRRGRRGMTLLQKGI